MAARAAARKVEICAERFCPCGCHESGASLRDPSRR